MVANTIFCEYHFVISVSFIIEGKETVQDLENTYVLLYI